MDKSLVSCFYGPRCILHTVVVVDDDDDDYNYVDDVNFQI